MSVGAAAKFAVDKADKKEGMKAGLLSEDSYIPRRPWLLDL